MGPAHPESNSPIFGFLVSKAVGAGLVWLALILVGACDQPGSGLNGQEPRQATGQATGQVNGLVVEVVARSIDEVETLRIRDSGGETWTFITEGYAGITPAHLREHQLFGDAVTVTYQEKDGPKGRMLVALEIAD